MIEPLESRLLLAAGPRQMEYLDRGIVATRVSSSTNFISWRSLALDPASMSFNVYRSTNGGTASKLNSTPLTGGTNYTDSTASGASASYSYFVKPVANGIEQTASPSYIVKPNTASGPLIQIPIRNDPGYTIRHISVADLDGDGKYDYIVDRIPPSTNEVSTQPNLIEAYESDGTFMWVVNAGPNSFDQDNIEPGASTIDVGNWDGVTAYDMDGDGLAEVLYRTAKGVVFGDGQTLTAPNNNLQFMSVIDGRSGAERAHIQLPTDFLSDGPMAASLGIGYLDGVHPTLVAKLKNRIGDGDFNQMFVAYDYDGTNITQRWKHIFPAVDSDNGHNIRIVDVDGDGKDEVADTAQVVDDDGTLLYNMRDGTPSLGHGDRFHIGDLDPDRPGLEGYAVQQNNPGLVTEAYWDAATGQVLQYHTTTSPGGCRPRRSR
jgi:rhamnogalacturonan endolyase